MKTAFQSEVMEILGISEEKTPVLPPEKERAFYTLAFEAYEKEDYRKAAKLFTQLVLTDPFSEHYWLGLASAKQMAREYMAAVHAWSLVALLKEGDPQPHFHAAECFLAVDEKQEALKALNAAKEFCKDEQLCEKINRLKAIHYGD